jgi:hypothetical protein
MTYNLAQKWKTARPRSMEFETHFQFTLLKIMENVRRVAVLESEMTEFIFPRLVVSESEMPKVILATVAVVKFRITSPDPSA